MTAGAPVQYRVEHGVAHLTLDRPEKKNALNAAVIAGIEEGLERAAQDGTVAVVLLRANGSDFCSGADLAELEESREQSRDASMADAKRMAALFTHMRRHPRPIVAAVHGRALAGGAGLATACDLVVAADDAQMGYPEVHLGFVPALVMTILRRKVGEGRAFELAALGDRIDAHTALGLGLVNRVFPAASFQDDAVAFVESLARRPATALTLTKGLLYELGDLSFEAGLARGAEVNVEARFTDACREGVRRFLDKSGRRRDDTGSGA